MRRRVSPDGESLFLLRQDNGVAVETHIAHSAMLCRSQKEPKEGDPEKVMSPHIGAWINLKENEAPALLRLGPRWARREAQAGRELSVADV